jgi:hypothetical protein
VRRVIRVVIVNGCADLVSHDDVKKWVDAIQRQIANDFAPVWNVGAVLHYAGDGIGDKPEPTDAVIRIVKDSSEPGTLGSHWFAGNPTGEVAIATCKDENVDPASCLSHENLELVLDPYGTMCFQLGRMILAGEASDRVENSDPYYKIDGVLVENFSLPSAFIGTSGPWDFRGKLTSNELAPAGYQLQVDLGSGQWSQVNGVLARRSKKKAGAGSRRALRMARAGADPSKLVALPTAATT